MADQPKQGMENFYYENPELSDEAKAILKNYSGIPETEQTAHVRAVRDKAWQLYRYPCIGRFAFITFSIGQSEHYHDALQRLKSGQNLLDLACCFGQDLRKLVIDGAPPENVVGSELEQGFIDLGYELFNDSPEKLKAKFIAADFFDNSGSPAPGLEEHSYDMIHAASFFHLFGWDEQVAAWDRALKMLKPKPGSMIFGRQTAVARATVLKHPATRSGEMYRHDLESFRDLVAGVAEKSGIEVDIEVHYVDGRLGAMSAEGWKMVRFCVSLK
ncbi:Uu.00g128230.m01.CDS01 [Anthostomella pinea]|uniref:Uu.00g128230.m01.CDS01 n=1 Tax=Anthostomella pinea TaxID=933095 RepID=A0AAI8YHY6_9PEZI|nr:Uu.00g128230.m01.CDS01 [Anthostomella pinea]